MSFSTPRPVLAWLAALALGGLVLGPLPAHAATYYVDGAGGSPGGNGSAGSPVNTIKAGLALLSPGDTLIVRDGLYQGEANCLSGPYGGYDGFPSGAAGAYITIKAENYLGAVIDGGEAYNPIFVWNASYLIFQNFLLRSTTRENGGANFRAQDAHHIKVLDCLSVEAYFGHFWFRNCHHTLVEDCAAFGRSAYSFCWVGEYEDYTRSQYNLCRRCVARRDAHFYPDHQANHFASFVAYWADHTYFQNCLSLDGVHAEDQGNVPDDDWIATTTFFTTNGASNYEARGCLALNEPGQIASFSPGDSEEIVFANNLAWMNDSSSFGVLAVSPRASYSVLGNTLAGVRGAGDYQGSGVGVTEGNIGGVHDNVILGCRIGMEGVAGPHGNNVLANDNNYANTAPGPGDRVDLDPRASGLSYLPRIEPGSALASAGRDGGRAGAEILNRLGAGGALFGEAGWDQQTGESLWPWPHQDQLAQRMALYNRHGVTGARGFAAGGAALDGGPVTLSSYIWEYLGNPCPDGWCR